MPYNNFKKVTAILNQYKRGLNVLNVRKQCHLHRSTLIKTMKTALGAATAGLPNP